MTKPPFSSGSTTFKVTGKKYAPKIQSLLGLDCRISPSCHRLKVAQQSSSCVGNDGTRIYSPQTPQPSGQGGGRPLVGEAPGCIATISIVTPCSSLSKRISPISGDLGENVANAWF